MTTIPTGPAEIDAAWMSDVLGLSVADVTAANLGDGVGVMAEVTRLHLEYTPGADPGPATLIAKTVSPAEANLESARTFGFYTREVAFYQQIAAHMDIRVPTSFHADMGPDGVPFVLLMEDVADARQIDQLEGVSLADAERVIDEIAKLHARWWDRPELAELTWLPPMNNDLYKGYGQVLPDLTALLKQQWGDRLDPAAMPWLDHLCTSYPHFLDWWIDDGPLTFCHYDLRPDNILFEATPDGGDQVCLLDWQLAVRHRGTFDLSYFLGQNVPTEFRRAHQDALLKRYHDALTGLGVNGYSFERCWDDYRAGMLMHVVAATQLQTLSGGNDRGQALLDAMLTQGWTSAVDLDAGDVLADLAP